MSQKFAVSIPGSVIGNFHLFVPFGRLWPWGRLNI